MSVTLIYPCDEGIIETPDQWSLRLVWCNLPKGHDGEHQCTDVGNG